MVDDKWIRIGLTYELESPVHIGYLPSRGSVVAPTRRYLPGRNFWGAVTKYATEYLFPAPTGYEYRKVGRKIRDAFRFSYFYIIEGEQFYCPCFTDQGLTYGTNGKISKEQLEYKFIGGRVSTAIDSDTTSAKLGSLHEIEYIKNRYTDEKGNFQNTKISGFVWIRKGTVLPASNGTVQVKVTEEGVFADEHNLLGRLSIGGEQSYGFGRIRILEVIEGKQLPFGEDNLKANQIIVRVPIGEPVFSHVALRELGHDRPPSVCFRGDIEILSGREYSTEERERFKKPGSRIVPPSYYFTPGTVFFLEDGESSTRAEIDFELQYDGTVSIPK